jgi:hypothetical protein
VFRIAEGSKGVNGKKAVVSFIWILIQKFKAFPPSVMRIQKPQFMAIIGNISHDSRTIY